MAVRRWAVRADEGSTVDRNEVVAAFMDGEAMLWRGGGVLTVLPHRVPTDLPGEMVTVAVVFEWKDRTDARSQPEVASPQPAAVAPAPVVEEPAAVEVPVLVGAGGIPDGLDPATLEDEDLSSIED